LGVVKVIQVKADLINYNNHGSLPGKMWQIRISLEFVYVIPEAEPD
jgi:hypothetical protein